MSQDGRYMRLVAEAEAWPISSMSAYRQRIRCLGLSATGVLDPESAKLSDTLEAHLRTRSAGMSLEALRGLRDHAWFNDATRNAGGQGSVPLAAYLSTLAARYLVCDGRKLSLKGGIPGSRSKQPLRVAHWRWLSLRIPPDLLIAGLQAASRCEPPRSRVDLGTFHLDEVLARPVAETHLHVGAALSFTQLWSFWMRWLASEGPSLQLLRRQDEYPFGGAQQFIAMLFSAAVSRLLLASFLLQRESPRRPVVDFADFCGEGLRSLAQRADWAAGSDACYRECRQALRHLVRGRSKHGKDVQRSLSILWRLYGCLARDDQRWQPRGRQDILRQDPLHRWLPADPGLAAPEIRFTTRALSYLLGSGAADDTFAMVFWQYSRVRCQAYAFLVEEPGTAGLDWFQNHYFRLSALRGRLDKHLYQSALDLDSEGLNLRSLEVRISPWADWSGLWREVRNLALCNASNVKRPHSAETGEHARPELGLLFHFLKERDNHKGCGNRTRLHADPAGSSTGFRYGAWYLERDKQARSIAFMLKHVPETLLLVRGVDVASSELAVPTWATLPFILRLRDASQQAAATLYRMRPHWDVPPFRATYHAGEEFRRLVEGLRRIHELFAFGAIRSGDRLGHGLALGIDAARWAERTHRVAQPREERLEDLLWELELFSSGALPGSGARLERTRSEVVRLGRNIYGPEGENPDALLRARRLRHQPAILERLGFPRRSKLSATADVRPFKLVESSNAAHFKAVDASDVAMRLVWRYLTDVEVFRRGQRPIEVWTDDSEVSFLEEAQRYLRALLRDQEVTIETNPSSNLLIADMTGLEDHPAFSLGEVMPMKGPREGSPPLLLSVNSDDPITFSTSLADEYAYLYFALLRSGHSASEALKVIDTLRENGWRSRFTVPASANPANMRTFASVLLRTHDG